MADRNAAARLGVGHVNRNSVRRATAFRVVRSDSEVIAEARMPVRDISSQGRDATGVRVMNLDGDQTVAAVAPVLGADED